MTTERHAAIHGISMYSAMAAAGVETIDADGPVAPEEERWSSIKDLVYTIRSEDAVIAKGFIGRSGGTRVAS